MRLPILRLCCALAALAAHPLAAASVRLSTTAFDQRVSIEVRNLPAETARGAIGDAFARLARIERLTDPDGETPGGIGRLNAAAGGGPVAIDPELWDLLLRARAFCVWSAGAQGPLGGRLYQLWGRDHPVPAVPSGDELEKAVAGAACGRLSLDEKGKTAAIPAGSRTDLWGFARGFAVDRATAVLEAAGATNGWIELGDVQRGFGPGPGGRGWPVVLPVFPGFEKPMGEIHLRDQALAVARADRRLLEAAGRSSPPYIDQRTGRPADGVQAVLAVTVLGLDAEGLASSMFITGNREGQFRLGQLRPYPSVRWLLGSGTGPPIVTDFRWAELTLP